MDKQLLKKYLEGDCSEEERIIVEKYLLEEKEDMEPFREILEQAWNNETTEAQAPGDQAIKLELQDDLHQRLFGAAGNKPARVVALRERSTRRLFYVAAAAAVSVVILGTFLWKYNSLYKAGAIEVPAITWKTLINTGHEQKTAVLPDNTRIWLNPGSQLSYANGLVDQQREVKLQGEAFFDVAQDAAHPFIVLSSRLTTKVLGTSFNIEAYPSEENVRVALVSGKVAVQVNAGGVMGVAGKHAAGEPAGEAVNLQAGQLFTYNAVSGKSNTNVLKMKNSTDWTNGQIVFTDVPLKDALARIASRLQLTLTYAKGIDLKDKRVSSVFTKESPDEILQLMLFASDCHFRRNGNAVEIFMN
jgi:transmembrane sensor